MHALNSSTKKAMKFDPGQFGSVQLNRYDAILRPFFYGHLKQEDLASIPVSRETTMFYGQLKQED